MALYIIDTEEDFLSQEAIDEIESSCAIQNDLVEQMKIEFFLKVMGNFTLEEIESRLQ